MKKVNCNAMLEIILPTSDQSPGGSRYGCLYNYNLGQNKMEQKTPIPPAKSRMKPREGQKRVIFPSLIWGGGEGRGGQGFPFILSKIIPEYPRTPPDRPDFLGIPFNTRKRKIANTKIMKKSAMNQLVL